MTDINWSMLAKLKKENSVQVQEFIKFLKVEYSKALSAVMATENDEFMKRKIVRAQTLKEILLVLGHEVD